VGHLHGWWRAPTSMGDGGGTAGDLRVGGGRRWRALVTGHVAGVGRRGWCGRYDVDI
jgi:hypothetical protein